MDGGKGDPTCTTEPDPPQGAVGDGACPPSPLDKSQETAGLPSSPPQEGISLGKFRAGVSYSFCGMEEAHLEAL